MSFAKITFGAFAFLGTLGFSAAAEAAVANLSSQTGKVLIDRGAGFQISSDLDLKVGDRIFVGDKSSAKVAYPGCTVRIHKEAVFVVGKASPCAHGENTFDVSSVTISPATALSVAAPSAGVLTGVGPVILLPPLALGGTLMVLTVSKP